MLCTTAINTSNTIRRTLPKLPTSVGDPDLRLIQGSLVPPESIAQPKRHLDRFSRFRRTHCRDQQTVSSTVTNSSVQFSPCDVNERLEDYATVNFDQWQLSKYKLCSCQ